MSEITEQDGELLIDGKPVDFRRPWEIEDVIRQLRAEIADLKTAMQRQANAARTLDMSHVARAETMMQHAQVLHDLSSPGELESLREANAILTADVERAEAELARLRAQGPVAWMWNDRPLYAEPMPAKSHPDICPCQTQPTHYAGEMPCPLSQAAKVAE